MLSTPSKKLRPLPGQHDQSARLAASAEVDQVVDTPTLEQFERWLSKRANAVRDELDVIENHSENLDSSALLLEGIEQCRTVFMFLAQFKQEQSA